MLKELISNQYIIQRTNEQYSVIYSYNSGRFYLLSNRDLYKLGISVVETRQKLCCEISEGIFLDHALNPCIINNSCFHSPLVIGVMITNYCNLSCVYCIARNGLGYSSINEIVQCPRILVQRLVDSHVLSVLVSGGEPTLYSELPDLLNAIALNDFLCLLDTNGVILQDELLSSLSRINVIPRVSLDSIVEEEHNATRGYYAETMRNIQMLLDHGISVRINSVLTSVNASNLEKLGEWMLSVGIDKWHIFKLQRQFAPPDLWINDETADNIINTLQVRFYPQIEILSKFKKTNDSFSSFVISSDGACFSTNNELSGTPKKIIFGNIFEDTIPNIWSQAPVDYRLHHYLKYLSFKNKVI